MSCVPDPYRPTSTPVMSSPEGDYDVTVTRTSLIYSCPPGKPCHHTSKPSPPPPMSEEPCTEPDITVTVTATPSQSRGPRASSSSTPLTSSRAPLPSSSSQRPRSSSSIISSVPPLSSHSTSPPPPSTRTTRSSTPPSSTSSSPPPPNGLPPYATDPSAYLPCNPGSFLCTSRTTFLTCIQTTTGWTYGASRVVAAGMDCLPFLSPCSASTVGGTAVCAGSGSGTVPAGWYRDDRYIRARPNGSCALDGALQCTAAGAGYMVCDQGGWVDMGAVAPGTRCVGSPGTIVAA